MCRRPRFLSLAVRLPGGAVQSTARRLLHRRFLRDAISRRRSPLCRLSSSRPLCRLSSSSLSHRPPRRRRPSRRSIRTIRPRRRSSHPHRLKRPSPRLQPMAALRRIMTRIMTKPRSEEVNTTRRARKRMRRSHHLRRLQRRLLRRQSSPPSVLAVRAAATHAVARGIRHRPRLHRGSTARPLRPRAPPLQARASTGCARAHAAAPLPQWLLAARPPRDVQPPRSCARRVSCICSNAAGRRHRRPQSISPAQPHRLARVMRRGRSRGSMRPTGRTTTPCCPHPRSRSHASCPHVCRRVRHLPPPPSRPRHIPILITIPQAAIRPRARHPNRATTPMPRPPST